MTKIIKSFNVLYMNPKIPVFLPVVCGISQDPLPLEHDGLDVLHFNVLINRKLEKQIKKQQQSTESEYSG